MLVRYSVIYIEFLNSLPDDSFTLIKPRHPNLGGNAKIFLSLTLHIWPPVIIGYKHCSDNVFNWIEVFFDPRNFLQEVIEFPSKTTCESCI